MPGGGLDPLGDDLRRWINDFSTGDDAARQTASEKLFREIDRIGGDFFRRQRLRLQPADQKEILQLAKCRLEKAFRKNRVQQCTNLGIVAYIGTTVRNTAKNWLRARRRREGHFQNPAQVLDGTFDDPIARIASSDLSPEEQTALRAKLERAVDWMMRTLGPVDRCILIRKILGASAEEIQRELGEAPYDMPMTQNAIDRRYGRLKTQTDGLR